MKKWIISDMDGTIIRHENDGFVIDDITIDAINHLIENDNKYEFTVATGRSCLDVVDIFKKYKINHSNDEYIIGMNGAQIYSFKENKLIKTFLLSHDQKVVIEDVIKEIEKDVEHMYVFGYNQIENEDKSIFFLTGEMAPDEEKIDKILSYEGKSSFIKHYYPSSTHVESPYKFVIRVNEGTDVNKLVSKYQAKYPQLSFFKTGPQYIEIGRCDVSKLTAVKYIQEHFCNIAKEHTYTLGDSGNDLDMLKYSKTSITRFDTDDHIKEACSHVYDDVASVFVGKAIEDIIKGKL